MPALIWHPDALADVARLHQFLARHNPAAARRGAAAIISNTTKIMKNPRLGAQRAEFREWPAKFGRRAYIIRYAILENDDVLITRVWHSREQRPS